MFRKLYYYIYILYGISIVNCLKHLMLSSGQLRSLEMAQIGKAKANNTHSRTLSVADSVAAGLSSISVRTCRSETI